MHLLSWDDEAGGDWLDEDFLKYYNEDGDVINSKEHVSCNTRKSRDKVAEKDHSVGIFVGAFPCGTIPLFDQLYGSEGTQQVYGIVTDFFDNLDEETLNAIKQLLYDDMCHFKKFAESSERSKNNEITAKIANMNKHVDKFHFRNHVDKWCQDNCNPDKVEGLKGVNTQICEQLFKKLNSHKNCKSLNEARFFLFFIYNIDLHNLSVGGMDISADPRSDFRWENIETTDVDWTEVDKKEPSNITEDDLVKELSTNLKTLSLKKKFTCSLCDNSYSQKGYLEVHIKSKHVMAEEVKIYNICEVCDKPQANKKALKRHMETHLKCTKCSIKFDSVLEADDHKNSPRFCYICNHDFEVPSKLKKHIESIHSS